MIINKVQCPGCKGDETCMGMEHGWAMCLACNWTWKSMAAWNVFSDNLRRLAEQPKGETLARIRERNNSGLNRSE